MKIGNYVEGKWVEGRGEGQALFDASLNEKIAVASTDGIEVGAVLDYARKVGSPKLRKMTFHERGRMLKALALHLTEKKDHFYKVSAQTGATKVDSWIDIEGGFGNLFTYASKGRRELPNLPYLVDGKVEHLSKGGTFLGHHICTALDGVAVHINAFNFPVWGMLEKIAVNLLAGMPAVVKPATATSYLTEVVVREIIKSEILPEGALQLLCGGARDLMDYVDSQDVVTFTGSASTGMMLKKHPNVTERAVRFNMEADSLNCSILGKDVTPEMPEFDIFIKEVAKEITIKAGQKCTAIRRIIVPHHLMDSVGSALSKRLEGVVVGDPRTDGVRMGPLASKSQLEDVSSRLEALKKSCKLIYSGDESKIQSSGEGFFMTPKLLRCDDALGNEDVHNIEAFGPISTLMGYETNEEAVVLAKKGKGSLVGSLVTYDAQNACEIVVSMASHHGRVMVLDRDCAKESTGHGSPMPQLVHGGPGRAGGGEEMGGLRGIHHYMQRTAIQGHPTMLTKITGVYQPGAAQKIDRIHPFKKYFNELEIGETLVTHNRTVTEADIVNFGNLSWDHFYAHTDDTSFDGTLFERRVAHGYFVISAAAGLFVDPAKGPVLANYGLDELRFIKPVYVGATINVHLTVKEKISQEKREDECARGIVKWLVDVKDETGESVALATILTLVERKEE